MLSAIACFFRSRFGRKAHSFVLAFMLFFLSIAIPLVVAKISVATPIEQPAIYTNTLPVIYEAKQFYERGQYQKSAELWQKAADTFANEGDTLNQAMALSNLSRVYQQLGQWENAKDAIASSLNLLNNSTLSTSGETRTLAQTLDIQGQLQREMGRSQEALETWQKTADIYAKIGDKNRLTQSQINQARALQDLGLYPKACKTLLEALELDDRDCKISTDALQTLTFSISQNNPVSSYQQILGLNALGEVLRVIGQLEQSQIVLNESLELMQKSGNSQDLSLVYLSLGNTARVSGKSDEALTYYNEATKFSTSPITQLRSQLDKLSLLIESEKNSDAAELARSLQPQIDSLPANRAGIYAQINFANSLMKLESKISQSPISNSKKIDEILTRSASQSKILGDERAYAYALGNRGKLYELNSQWEQAENLTKQALNSATSYQSPDIAYQFVWQLGRIRKAVGDREGAIVHYTSAVNTLKSLRTDLVAISSEAQFSFRESVEPVYRELVELLLQPGTQVKQSDLIIARNTIESLQLAELDNFFKDACVTTKPIQIDQIDPTAAIFYTIILSDRLEAIAALPNQPLRHYGTPLPQEQIEATLKKLRETLTAAKYRNSIKSFLPYSQKVYDWLIRPIETDLAASQVKNLVFVLDGELRNIPLSALYDGKQYLLEKYSVALTPGLQLLDPKPLPKQQLKVLTAGLTEPRQGFSALPNVALEFKSIGESVPTQILLNQSFTDSNFKSTLKSFSFPIVHLATHGEFSSKAENTYILTWDDKINANALNNLLRNDSGDKKPIELLVLSACRTAVGDKRAALGLAGVAVRAGARSTLASLWYVSDEATSLLMTRFYQELASQEVTKAEALSRAQKSILQDEKFAHPYFWAAFVLVGNWL